MLVILVAGIPCKSVVKDPVIFLSGPITIFEATPPATPALSPLLMVPCVDMLWAGVPPIKTFVQGGTLVMPVDMLG